MRAGSPLLSILLGIALGMMSRANATPEGGARDKGARLLNTAAALACAVLLLPAGWTATRVTRELWTSYFSHIPLVSNEAKIDALTAAIDLMPTAAFHQERAALHQADALAGEGRERQKSAELGIADPYAED